ncbi:adenosine deaminase [Motilibacter sp. E257]|uniref:Adenosine deaminase n=2 Tax=Motilibacter deserti TaxID=2714956 RepID=A0ABX0GQE8_9ACTN|nr:adenosine deaminase [Motilibacter deserti]
MQPSTLLQLLAKHRGLSALEAIPNSPDALREWYAFRDFAHFIEVYLASVEVLRDPEDFELLSRTTALGLAAQQVRYAEVTWSPQLHLGRGLPLAEVFAGLEQGRRAAEAESGVVLRWVTDVSGHLGPDEAERALDAVLELEAPSVIGFGLGGPEVDRADYAHVFARARAAGLRSLPHAGEVTGPESVWSALDDLGAERIGHGIAAARDPRLLARLAAEQVALEVCPTSNVRTRVVPSLAEHPLRRLLDAGVPVTIASDDPPMFGTTLHQEHLACLQQLGLRRAELMETVAVGVRASSAPEPLRQRVLEELAAVPLD